MPAPVPFEMLQASSPSPAVTNRQQASNAYNNSRYHGISERGTMAEAFRVMITNMHSAKDAYKARQVDVMCDLNVKTLNIITLLASGIESSNALTDPDARKSALFMANVYNEVFVRLTNVLRTPSPDAEFDALIAALLPVYRIWQQPEAGAGVQITAANASA